MLCAFALQKFPLPGPLLPLLAFKRGSRHTRLPKCFLSAGSPRLRYLLMLRLFGSCSRCCSLLVGEVPVLLLLPLPIVMMLSFCLPLTSLMFYFSFISYSICELLLSDTYRIIHHVNTQRLNTYLSLVRKQLFKLQHFICILLLKINSTNPLASFQLPCL